MPERAQPFLAPHGERADVDEAAPDLLLIAAVARQQRLHGLAQPALLVTQLEVHGSLLRKAEHPPGDDVALDLLCAAVDRRGARVEVGLVPERVL